LTAGPRNSHARFPEIGKYRAEKFQPLENSVRGIDFAARARHQARPMSQTKHFTGFGLGAIQSGLFLLEAQRAQNYARHTIAEVDPAIVAALRAA
jgi:hypothetical protein